MDTMTVPGARAGRREWLGLAVLALPALLLSLDISVLLLALPQLSAELGASGTQQLWITDVYGFMVAGFLVTMGTLGDRIGRRTLLLGGAAMFAATSALAAFATGPEMLIALRALMGIAGATVMPSALALISSMFTDPRQRGTAIAACFSCFMAGGALGPVVGGVLLEFFWWGSVFLLGVPVMVLLVVAGPLLLPADDRTARAGSARLDLASVALLLVAVLATVHGLKGLARDGFSAVPVAALLAGLVIGALFVRRQGRLKDPLLDLRLFGHRTLRSALVVMLLSGIVLGGAFLVVTQFLQLVAGLAPLQAGLWMVAPSVAMIAGVLAAPRLAQRFRPGSVMAAGLAVAALGALALSQVGVATAPGLVVACMTVLMVGLGLPGGLAVDLIVGSAPPERAGSAASLATTSQELGLALGLAALGSVATAVYRQVLMVPGDAPAAARESLAGAVAADLPALLGPARESFTSGLSVVAGLGAVLFAALAVLAARTLRHVPPTGATVAEPAQEPVAA